MIWIWIGFVALILALLVLDLGVFHRKSRAAGLKESLLWSAFWIALGLGFGAIIYFGYEQAWLGMGTVIDAADGVDNDGGSALLKYLTGYIVEKSLSVDNLFVIAMIFGSFAVPPAYQHRVLFWGIVGALVFRGAMIGVGAHVIARHQRVLYVFGAFLLFTAVKMLLARDEGHADPSKNAVVRALRRFVPVTDAFHGRHFVVRDNLRRRWALTPLAVSVAVIETTDVIFAVDSIPAVFAITADPFLVFTSNVFAMLGLRSLYFALAGMWEKFRYLKVSLAVVLAVVGAKMLCATWLHAMLGPAFNLYLLALIGAILATGVIASRMIPARAVENQLAR